MTIYCSYWEERAYNMREEAPIGCLYIMRNVFGIGHCGVASADGKKQNRVIGVEYWNARARHNIITIYYRRRQWRQWRAAVDCKLGINSTHGLAHDCMCIVYVCANMYVYACVYIYVCVYMFICMCKFACVCVCVVLISA